jgi:hypothetical protein
LKVSVFLFSVHPTFFLRPVTTEKNRLPGFRENAEAAEKQQKQFISSRVARFFLVQHTKQNKLPLNIPNGHKIYKMAVKYTQCRKIDQIAIK